MLLYSHIYRVISIPLTFLHSNFLCIRIWAAIWGLHVEDTWAKKTFFSAQLLPYKRMFACTVCMFLFDVRNMHNKLVSNETVWFRNIPREDCYCCSVKLYHVGLLIYIGWYSCLLYYYISKTHRLMLIWHAQIMSNYCKGF